MGGEELGFVLLGLSDCDILIDLLLRATFDAIVPQVEGVNLSLKEV